MFATRRCLATLLIVATSCARTTASTGGIEPSGIAASPRAPRSDRVISKAELEDPVIQTMDAFKAIEQLRPGFLRQTAPQSYYIGSAGLTQISQDYGPLQPLSRLSVFDVLMLSEIRFLDVNEAQFRFGLNANGGPVIVLLTRKQ